MLLPFAVLALSLSPSPAPAPEPTPRAAVLHTETGDIDIAEYCECELDVKPVSLAKFLEAGPKVTVLVVGKFTGKVIRLEGVTKAKE